MEEVDTNILKSCVNAGLVVCTILTSSAVMVNVTKLYTSMRRFKAEKCRYDSVKYTRGDKTWKREEELQIISANINSFLKKGRWLVSLLT